MEKAEIIYDNDQDNGLRKSLPSYFYFKNIFNNFTEDASKLPGINVYYSPCLAKVLVDDFMPLSPLWSPTSGKEHKHGSNAEIEGSFHLLKRDMASGERFTLTNFVRKCFAFAKNNVNEMVFNALFII